MKVVIVGAGALGKCLTALLADQATIVVYERDQRIYQALKKGWIILKQKERIRKVKVHAVASLAELRGERIDILIFTTKVMDLPQAVRQTAGLDVRCVLFPQNGLFDVRPLRRFLKTKIICRAVTTMACQETAQERVTLFYQGAMYLSGKGARYVAALFRRCGIKTKIYRDPQSPVWAKLIFSSVMNPLPVMTGQGYEVLRKDQKVWKLVLGAVAEGRAVAKALGVRLAFDPLQLIRRVRSGDLAGIAHRGTIFQDVCAGRRSEIEHITGALIRQARKIGVKPPALNFILSQAKAAGA